jgi:hypothetical protein
MFLFWLIFSVILAKLLIKCTLAICYFNDSDIGRFGLFNDRRDADMHRIPPDADNHFYSILSFSYFSIFNFPILSLVNFPGNRFQELVYQTRVPDRRAKKIYIFRRVPVVSNNMQQKRNTDRTIPSSTSHF